MQGSTASNQLALDDPNLRNLAAEVRDEFLKATSGEDSCEHVIMSMSNIYIYTHSPLITIVQTKTCYYLIIDIFWFQHRCSSIFILQWIVTQK